MRGVDQPLAAVAEPVEKALRPRARCAASSSACVDLAAQRRAAGEPRGVPAEVLARGAHARLLAVERVVVVEMLEDQRARLGDRRRRQVLAGREEVRDLAEDPRTSLRGAADHQRVRAGAREHVARALRRIDVAVRDDRDRTARLTAAIVVVLDGADERAGARAAVDGERRDAGVLGDARDRERVARVGCRPGADLERDRHVDGAHDRLDDRGDQRLVGRAAPSPPRRCRPSSPGSPC